MLRTVLRPLPRFVRPVQAPVAHLAARSRTFASKPKIEDGTLEGRYATALFMASEGKLDKVYQDMIGIKTMMEESEDFKLVLSTPSIKPPVKIDVLEAVLGQAGSDVAVVNFVKVLIENKRLSCLSRMIDLFEEFYRAEKGLVACSVTSAEPLSEAQKGQVKAAMETRAGADATLIMDYQVNSLIMGGVVVNLGGAVLDQSVQTRLERLQTRLLAPVA